MTKTHGWPVGGGRENEGLRQVNEPGLRQVNEPKSRHQPSRKVGIAPFQHVLSKFLCLMFESSI